MECPACKASVADGARFCSSCGAAVPGDTDATASLRPADADTTTALPPVDATAVVAPRPDSTNTIDPPPQRAGQLRSCRACGAENSAGRVLCARCGADLESGSRPGATPVAHHPGPAQDVTGTVTPPGSGRRIALVVAVIIAVGGALGTLIGLFLADRGGSPEGSDPVFDPGVYVEDPEALAVTGVGASSERPPSGEATYGAGNLVDQDVTTAWSHDPAVEAAADVDLALALAEPSWVTSLTFANGAQSDDLAFTADGRVLRLRLLVDGDAAAELQLLDQSGLQRVELPEPVLVDTIRLVVLEAVAGDTYDEISLSEIVVSGHPARGQDLARMLTDQDAGA